MVTIKESYADFQNSSYKVKKFNFNREFFEGNYDYSSLDFKLSHCIISDAKIDLDSDESIYCGELELNLQIYDKSNSNNCFLECTIEGRFVGNPNYFDEAKKFSIMLESNGIAFLYSMIRLVVMGITPYLGEDNAISLPMLNVFRYLEKIKEFPSSEKKAKSKKTSSRNKAISKKTTAD